MHALLSLQEIVVKTHPVAGLQLSAVHALPSSQVRGAPGRQRPSTQPSPTVQASPSLQGISALVPAQTPRVHVSVMVQGLWSSHAPPLVPLPERQAPPLQWSLAVQALPSSQGTVFAVPGWHVPPEQ